MPDLQTEAIVLHRTDYRDADRMVALFSPEHGRLDACARGIRKPSSKMKAACEPFVTGTFQLSVSGGRATLTSFSLTEGFFPLRNDYSRLTQASYALSVVRSVVQPEKAYPEVFSLLQRTLGRFAYSDMDGENLLTRFLLMFAGYEGFEPSLRECVRCGRPVEGRARFLFDGGGVCHGECASYALRVSDGAMAYMRRAREGLDADGEDSAGDVSMALDIACKFIETHLGGRMKVSGRLRD